MYNLTHKTLGVLHWAEIPPAELDPDNAGVRKSCTAISVLPTFAYLHSPRLL